MTASTQFSLPNLLHGRIAEQILIQLLERNGYHVTRLGIEALLSQIKCLDHKSYLALGLPDRLRALPDLLVADPAVKWAKLIEVKYRRSFTRDTADGLFTKLSHQRSFWPESYAVILLGEPFFPNGRYHQNCIRVVPPDQTELLRGPGGIDVPGDEPDAMRLVWDQLPTLGTLFRFRDFELFGEQRDDRGRAFRDDADSVTATIRGLGRS